MPAEMCVNKIWRNYGFHICGNAAKLEHEGSWYCKRHHPLTVAARDAERNAKWAAKKEAASLEMVIKTARESVIGAAIAWHSAGAWRGKQAESLDAAVEALQEAGKLFSLVEDAK